MTILIIIYLCNYSLLQEVEANTDMEVTSEARENNEVDLTSQECSADTNNMNETNDVQNEETEQSMLL